MLSNTPDDPTGRPRRRFRWRAVVVTLSLLLLLLLLLVCVGRFGRFVESIAFFIPTRQAFQTPPGIEDVLIPAGDADEIHAWWIPCSPDVAHRGTVLYCHGNSGALPDHLGFVWGLPDRGFDVLMFDYRGFGRSSQVSRMERRTLLHDAKLARDYIRERHGESELPLVLLGHSMGSAIGSALVADDPGAFDAAALVAPFSSFTRVASDFTGPLGWLLIPGGQAPEEAVTRFDTTPLLIVHGTRDGVVRPYHGERVRDAAQGAGVDVEFRSVSDADHETVFDDRFGTLDAIAGFFATSNRD